jgi:hypothetical protein
VVGGLDLAAAQVRGELLAVADAQHGDAEVEEPGSTPGAPSSKTLDGPPERMIADRGARRTASRGIVQGWISQ